jgi:hypothetical protein
MDPLFVNETGMDAVWSKADAIDDEGQLVMAPKQFSGQKQTSHSRPDSLVTHAATNPAKLLSARIKISIERFGNACPIGEVLHCKIS